MRKFSSYVIAAAVVLALALCPVAARADSTTFDLTYATTQGGTLANYPGPYAQVTVDLTNSTTATITYTTVGFGGGNYYMGDGKTVGLNVNANSFTANITNDPYWANTIYGSQTFDGSGFGNINFSISNACNGCDGGYDAGLVQTISFTLTDNSGKWNSASQVLVLNAEGFDAVSHMTVENEGTCAPGKFLCHGYAGNNPVPEPPVNALLACSALLFGGLFLRRPLWS